MVKNFSFISKYKMTFLFTGISLFLSLLLIFLSRSTEGFAQWYAVTIYPILPMTIGRFFSALDFSIFEAGILFMIGTAVFLGIEILWILFSRNSFRKRTLFPSLRIFLCILSGLLLVYTLTCSINYQRDGIGTVLKLPVEINSRENLDQLLLLLVEDLTALTNDPDWNYSMLAAEDTAYIETEAVSAMKQLGEKDPSLAGFYPQPKPIYFSSVLSDLGIEGIYSPFTMEANYNNDMTYFLIPYTICHELAHLKGYMKEDDAGFIAYLACKNSPSKIFQYSGMFHALTFSLNALKSEISNEEFNEVYQKLPETIKIQLSYIREKNKNASSAASLAKSVNHLYLLANAQLEGAKSYGRMVDLLIADHADRFSSENML